MSLENGKQRLGWPSFEQNPALLPLDDDTFPHMAPGANIYKFKLPREAVEHTLMDATPLPIPDFNGIEVPLPDQITISHGRAKIAAKFNLLHAIDSEEPIDPVEETVGLHYLEFPLPRSSWLTGRKPDEVEVEINALCTYDFRNNRDGK